MTKYFFLFFFFLVVFVFFCKAVNTAILFSPKINLSILRPIYFTPPLFVYHLFTVIFEFIPYPCGASEWFRNYFKLQLRWVYAQVAAFHNDVSNNFEINMIASRTASQLFLSNDDLSMTSELTLMTWSLSARLRFAMLAKIITTRFKQKR